MSEQARADFGLDLPPGLDGPARMAQAGTEGAEGWLGRWCPGVETAGGLVVLRRHPSAYVRDRALLARGRSLRAYQRQGLPLRKDAVLAWPLGLARLVMCLAELEACDG